MEQKEKLVPIRTVGLDGEIVRRIFFVNFAGGEKMYWLFESGKVLVMPVYKECPVQAGTLHDLAQDFHALVAAMEDERGRLLIEAKNFQMLIEEINNGVDSS